MVNFSGEILMVFDGDPFVVLKLWLTKEKKAGVPNPMQGVLSTSTQDAIPHSRVVAVKQVNEEGLIFFTQKGTRKVSEIAQNPRASFVFWFELLQREVVLEGLISPLTDEENNHHWQEYPKEAQIRFYSYAPTSSKPIQSKQQLESLRLDIRNEYRDKELPINQYYKGFRLTPERIVFYVSLAY
jgi:pyridoxamine 5'-phosphate oxidase